MTLAILTRSIENEMESREREREGSERERRHEKQLLRSANILKTCQSNLMKVSYAFRLLNVSVFFLHFGSFRVVPVVVVVVVVVRFWAILRVTGLNAF